MVGWFSQARWRFVFGSFAQEGHKQTLQTTLAIYNGIFEGSGDTRKIYRDLTKAIEGTEKRREDVRKKVSEMENEAHKFFAEWTESLDTIGSEGLRQRGKERLDKTRVRYGEILTEGRRAGAELEPSWEGFVIKSSTSDTI